jgi:signal transduction histidine kinase
MELESTPNYYSKTASSAMTIRKKTLIITGAISLLIFSYLTVVTRFFLIENIHRFEIENSLENAGRTVAIFNHDNEHLVDIVSEYAEWDETYNFAETLDPGYIHTYFSAKALSDLNLNYFIYISPDHEVKRSIGYDSDPNILKPIPYDFYEMITTQPYFQDLENKGHIVGIVSLKTGPLLFSSQPVVKTNGEGPSRGTVILARYITENSSTLLSGMTQMNVQVASYFDSDMRKELESASPETPGSTSVFSRIIDDHTIAGYSIVNDVFGKPAMIIRSDLDREFFTQVVDVIYSFIYVIMIGTIFAAIIYIIVFDHEILKRILSLSNSVKRIRFGMRPNDRLPLTGNDEITTLASEINEMLHSLEEYDHELTRSKVELEKRISERTSELQVLNMELKHEIKERELGEKALIETYYENNQILGSISSLIIGVNSEMDVAQWNEVASNLLRLPMNEVMGKSFFKLPINWDWAAIRRQSEICLENHARIRMDDIILSFPGEESRIIGITMTPLFLKDEKHPGFLLVGSDITERRLLEQKLMQASQLEAIGQMAAGIAHEINTPTQLVGSNLRYIRQQLADILNLIEKVSEVNNNVKQGTATPEMGYLLQKAADEAHVAFFREEAPKAISDSLEGIDRISHIVSAMRYFSHPATEMKVKANINQVIQNALSLSRNEWKNVAEIETELDEDLPSIDCHPSELSQTILNLIINAVHAIKDVNKDNPCTKGKISIQTCQAGRAIEIRLSDTGTGIPEEIRDRVFNPFFTTKDVGVGTGQGLALCYTAIVKKHGGTIEFETEVGRGTTFIIHIPGM